MNQDKIPVMTRRIPKNAALLVKNKDCDVIGIEDDPDVEENMISLTMQVIMDSKYSGYDLYEYMISDDMSKHISESYSNIPVKEYRIIDTTLTNPIIIPAHSREEADKMLAQVKSDMTNTNVEHAVSANGSDGAASYYDQSSALMHMMNSFGGYDSKHAGSKKHRKYKKHGKHNRYRR